MELDVYCDPTAETPLYEPIGEDVNQGLYVYHITSKWACKESARVPRVNCSSPKPAPRPPTCNGKIDPAQCLSKYGGKCSDIVIGELVRENCPLMCGTCNTCSSACIPKGVKRKDGQNDCCTEGRKTLKCPGPAHYQCGAHTLSQAEEF